MDDEPILEPRRNRPHVALEDLVNRWSVSDTVRRFPRIDAMQGAGQLPVEHLHAKKRRRLALITPDFHEHRRAIQGQGLQHAAIANFKPEKSIQLLVIMRHHGPGNASHRRPPKRGAGGATRVLESHRAPLARSESQHRHRLCRHMRDRYRMAGASPWKQTGRKRSRPIRPRTLGTASALKSQLSLAMARQREHLDPNARHRQHWDSYPAGRTGTRTDRQELG